MPRDGTGRDGRQPVRSVYVATAVAIAAVFALPVLFWWWIQPDPMWFLELKFGPAEGRVEIVEFESSVLPFVSRVYWKLELESEAALESLTMGMDLKTTGPMPKALSRPAWWRSRDGAEGPYYFGVEPGHQVDRVLWYDPVTREAFLEWSKG